MHMCRIRLAGTVGVCVMVLVLAGCGLFAPHTVSTPDTPSGPTSGPVGGALSFSSGGALCSRGHPVEYRFAWGDGTYSDWDPSSTATNTWDIKDTHRVRAQARCMENTDVVSDWSPAQEVVISAIGVTRSNDRLAVTLQGLRTEEQIGSGASRREPAEGNVFVIVDLRAEALRDGVAVLAEAFLVVQADGVTHQRSGVTAALNEQRLDSRGGMFAGETESGALAFEVCAQQQHYTLEYRPTTGTPISFRFTL